MRKDSKLKVLGLIFETDLKKTTADNYERIFNTINKMINQNCRRKFNLIQKVWNSNTFIKNVAHQPPLGQDKTGY
jgi:hypothetical protein